jgi:hypothetical protein
MTDSDAFVSHQEKILQGAMKLSMSKTQVSNIFQYFPQSSSEIETQEFNIMCKIPRKLLSDEEIAMWFLESEKLNRSNAELYFANPTDSSARSALEKLAAKICSLEIAYGFVEGLKFFLPVVGCWNSDEINNNFKSVTMKYVLKIFVQAHLQYSKTPIFTTGFENVPFIVEIALAVLDLCRVLEKNKTAQAVAMSDFFAALREIMKRGDSLTMHVKAMTDLFTAASSGRPMSALQLPVNLPSYLFATSGLSGYVKIGFRLDETFRLFFARLGSDALYLFDPTTSVANEYPVSRSFFSQSAQPFKPALITPYKLRFCIPLDGVHIRYFDDMYATSERGSEDEGVLLEMSSISVRLVPVIEYNTEEYYESEARYVQHEAMTRREQKGVSNDTNKALSTTPASTAAAAATSSVEVSSSKRVTIDWPGPKAVKHYKNVYINPINKPQANDGDVDNISSKSAADSGGEKIMDLHELSILWLDSIENSCWESRTKLIGKQ